MLMKALKVLNHRHRSVIVLQMQALNPGLHAVQKNDHQVNFSNFVSDTISYNGMPLLSII